MSETVGHSPDRAMSGTARGISGPLIILILAVAPQIINVVSTLVLLVLGMGTKNPLQALVDHIAAFGAAVRWLGWAITFLPDLVPTAISALFAWKSALLTPVFAKIGGAPPAALLPLIFSYPLFALGALSFYLKPRCKQDYYGGIALMGMALFALWASSDLQGMQGFSFGAGTAPRMFAVLLLILGFGVMLTGILAEGPPIQQYHWRGPFFVSLAIISFAFTIRPLGLVISAFASFMIAALGTPETRWGEAALVGVCLTIGCSRVRCPTPRVPWHLAPTAERRGGR